MWKNPMNETRTSAAARALVCFANFLLAGIMLLVMLLSFNALFQPDGAPFVANESSVFSKNLSGILLSIDGKSIASSNEFRQILSSYSPGDSVRVSVTEGVRVVPKVSTTSFMSPVLVADGTNVTEYTVVLKENPESEGRPYLGVAVPQIDSVRNSGFVPLYSLFFWIFVLNLGIGIVNILPIKPLDGGLFFEELVGRFTKNTKMVVRTVSVVVLSLLVFNLLGPVFF